VFTDVKHYARGCVPIAERTDCQSAEYNNHEGELCICTSEKCNMAAMTSSLGHVIIVVALGISVIIGYLV